MPEDFLQQLERLNQKIDALLKDKVDLQYYRDRHEELGKRVDRLEQGLEIINEKIGGLHNSSMAWVNEALAKQTEALNASTRELERRIFDKIEERSTFSRSQWMLIGVAVIGWLLSIGIAIFK